MTMKKQQKSIINRNFADVRSSYRTSNRHKSVKKKKAPVGKFLGVVLLIAIIFTVPTYAYFHSNNKVTKTTEPINPKTSIVADKPVSTPAVSTVQTSECTTNTISTVIIVSISQRHLWACDGSQMEYQTAVVTGDMNVAADVTPVGTYHIYGKHTDLYLNGSDSRGSWHDYVNYWMPFLDNEYGTFGLHDATWRSATDFGNISPYSDNASHGCVELPLSAAQWLFNWSSIGTTVVIES